MIDNDQDAVSDGDGSSFRPSSFGNATIVLRKTNNSSDETPNEQLELKGIVTRDCLYAFSQRGVCLHCA